MIEDLNNTYIDPDSRRVKDNLTNEAKRTVLELKYGNTKHKEGEIYLLPMNNYLPILLG